jgi:hypothetical protein
VRALTCELLHTQCLILCYLGTVKYNEGENIGHVAAEKLDGPGGSLGVFLFDATGGGYE